MQLLEKLLKETVCRKCGKENEDGDDWAGGAICSKCRKKAESYSLYDEEYRLKGRKDKKHRKARADRGKKRKKRSSIFKSLLHNP